MLDAKKVFFTYERPGWLLEDVNLTIHPGEVVGLPGPSGRGKSTLARLLAGYLHPQRGRVTYNGEELPTAGFCPVQLLFQHPEIALNPRWKLGDSISEAGRPDPAILKSLNIEEHWLTRFPHELSGGELQRLALARVMTKETRFLIADEMTAMLDPNTQAMVWDAVLAWAGGQGVGILAVSHDRHLLERVAHRIDDRFEPRGDPGPGEQQITAAA